MWPRWPRKMREAGRSENILLSRRKLIKTLMPHAHTHKSRTKPTRRASIPAKSCSRTRFNAKHSAAMRAHVVYSHTHANKRTATERNDNDTEHTINVERRMRAAWRVLRVAPCAKQCARECGNVRVRARACVHMDYGSFARSHFSAALCVRRACDVYLSSLI